MITGLRLELKDVEPIVSANLDINKINIIGGKNATGKSTASKLLYCFLKVNCSDRDKLVKSTIIKSLNNIYRYFRVYDDRHGSIDPELYYNIRRIKMMLNRQHYDDFDEIIDLFVQIEPLFYDALEKNKFNIESEKRMIRRRMPEKRISNPNSEKVLADFNKIKRILKSIEDNHSDFFKEVMKDLISSEFDIDLSFDAESYKSPSYRINNAKLYDSLNSNFSFEITLNQIGKEFESEGEFYINNVFYLESFSIFDNYLSFKSESFHVEDLKEYLFPRKRISKMFEDESIGELEKIINHIVGGRIVEDKLKGLEFISNDSSYSCSMKNTASGIKQIAVIQTLLRNRFLGNGSVLIMDEPEVNLHPEWQIKLARILVLLAKEGNITIYINSHSPMFIEAMDTFSEYYDFEEYVSYYLSEKIEDEEININSEKLDKKENRVLFKKIPSDELYKIYDNLGDPYDYLDNIRLSKGKKEGNNDFNI